MADAVMEAVSSYWGVLLSRLPTERFEGLIQAVQLGSDAIQASLTNATLADMPQALFGRKEIPPTTVAAGIFTGFLVFLTLVGGYQKVKLSLWGVWYFVASRDKKMRKPDDQHFDYSRAQRKRIVFIRHGESEWNQVFNKGFGPSFPVRLIRAILGEASLLFQQDSIFYDSPLSPYGIEQAMELLTFLASQPQAQISHEDSQKAVKDLEPVDIVSVIRGDIGHSIVVSSILRRAISTTLMGLSSRLLRSQERVHVMTSLQEISRNVDTLSITPAKKSAKPPLLERTLKHMDHVCHFYQTRLSVQLNTGNKTLSQKGLHRQGLFCEWAFKQDADWIIVGGHSLWFREFFKSFLPRSVVHTAKTTKMVNCGVVAFDLFRSDTNKDAYRIHPDGIKEVYGGFEIKKKKK